MLGTKELTKNMKITTARTDTHFTSRTLSVILCCGGQRKMCSFIGRLSAFVLSEVAERRPTSLLRYDQRSAATVGWGMSLGWSMNQYLLLQFLDVLLPVFVFLRNLSVQNKTQQNNNVFSSFSVSSFRPNRAVSPKKPVCNTDLSMYTMYTYHLLCGTCVFFSIYCCC